MESERFYRFVVFLKGFVGCWWVEVFCLAFYVSWLLNFFLLFSVFDLSWFFVLVCVFNVVNFCGLVFFTYLVFVYDEDSLGLEVY